MRIRYTKDETRRIAAANRVIDNPAAIPGETLKALRELNRLETAAERRAADREEFEFLAPAEPSIDQLVIELEKDKKQPLQVIDGQGVTKLETDQLAINAALAPPIPAKASEVTPTVLEPLNDDSATSAPPDPAFCGFCQAAGPWNTRWPVEEPNGVLLCLSCFAKMCSAEMLKAAQPAARRDVLAGRGEDPNAFDLATVHPNASRSDWERSAILWRQMDAEAAEKQAAERRERETAEAQFHSARADYLSRGGKL